VAEITVTRLALTPVKAMRLATVDAVELEDHGARGDRRFYLIDERGKMVNGKQHGRLQTIIPTLNDAGDALTLTFPDGATVTGPVVAGAPVTARFYRRTDDTHELAGPFSEAVSDFIGHPLRIILTRTGVDRGHKGGVSLLSAASLRRLAAVAQRDEVDARRFRMLIEIDGVPAHAEDRWIGRQVRVGETLLAMHGHVGRCLITSRDADTGEVTLPTLDLLRSYREEEETTEPLAFGVYGEVLEPGQIRIGDPVVVEQTA
jgi:uncharacterized protein YcbX